MKTLNAMWLLGSLALGTGCVGARVEERLPSVRKLENWKEPFHGWSQGVDFPVTVVVTAPARGAFRAYGVDPDCHRILFMADGDAGEHLRDIPGDPLWGTVVVLDAKALSLVEASSREPRHASALERVQVAVELVRDAQLPVRVTQR